MAVLCLLRHVVISKADPLQYIDLDILDRANNLLDQLQSLQTEDSLTNASPSTKESAYSLPPSSSSSSSSVSMFQSTTMSTSPTELYPWCVDTETKFSIHSVSWIQNKKSCSWANVIDKKPYRCRIKEVKINCPSLCGNCQCLDNKDRFRVSNLGTYSCEWPKNKDTVWRCNQYPEVKHNCPLTCGECKDLVLMDPSTALSSDNTRPTTEGSNISPSQNKGNSPLTTAVQSPSKKCSYNTPSKGGSKAQSSKENTKSSPKGKNASLSKGGTKCPSAAPSSIKSAAPSSHTSFFPSTKPSLIPSIQKTLSPSTSPPTISLAPSSKYEWCQDNLDRFTIESIKWIKSKKSCTWADSSKKWFRCTIDEVKTNCPVTCDRCNCIDNDARFSVSDLGKKKKSCAWPRRHDTWFRCNKYPEVMRNCPLTCGQCEEIFPSDTPSAAPSIKLFPSITITADVEFCLAAVNIPNETSELSTFVSILRKAYSIYVPKGASITEVVTYPSTQVSEAEGYTKYTTSEEFLCETVDCGDQQDIISEFKKQTKTLTTLAIQNNAIHNQVKAIANGLDFYIRWILCPKRKINIKFDEMMNDPTVRPSQKPTNCPTTDPTFKPSHEPNDNPSIVPSVALSKVPSEIPTFQPSRRPTKTPSMSPTEISSETPSRSAAPSEYPSQKPSSHPSENPSAIPSEYPSQSPSEEPTEYPSKNPSGHPSEYPSEVPSKHPSEDPSQKPSEHPSALPSGVPSGYPSQSPSEEPSAYPSTHPSEHPSEVPSEYPSELPSEYPSHHPSKLPSHRPSQEPSEQPSALPSEYPSEYPSQSPSAIPSEYPSEHPSVHISVYPSYFPSELSCSVAFKEVITLIMSPGTDPNQTTFTLKRKTKYGSFVNAEVVEYTTSDPNQVRRECIPLNYCYKGVATSTSGIATFEVYFGGK